MRTKGSKALVTVLTVVVLFAGCNRSPLAPTDPQKPGSTVENVNPPGSPPVESYLLDAGELVLGSMNTGFYHVPVPKGAVTIVPKMFMPARHNSLPAAELQPVQVTFEATLDASMPMGQPITSYYLYFSTTDGVGNYSALVTGTCPEFVPGQTVTCTAMCPMRSSETMGGTVKYLGIRLMHFRGSSGGPSRPSFPEILVPLDWFVSGTR